MKLVNECKQIQEDSTYTAEAHHLIAAGLSVKAFRCKFYPALFALASALALILGVKDWVAWITVISGTVVLYNVFVEPEKKAQQHVFAAKQFTVLKHEARSLHESFKEFMAEMEFYHGVRVIREKYNLLVQFSPPTDDKRVWDEARRKIKAGIHKPSYRN